MTEKDVKRIVEATIEEFLNRDLLKKEGNLSYQFMSEKLEQFFRTKKPERIADALEEIRKDEYYKIIPEYYKFHRTHFISIHGITDAK